MIRVLISVEDSAFGERIAAIVSSAPDFSLIGSGQSPYATAHVAAAVGPTVAIISIDLRDSYVIEAVEDLCRRSRPSAVIAVVSEGSDAAIIAAHRAGAAAWCDPQVRDAGLLNLVRRSASGDRPILDAFLDRPWLTPHILDPRRPMPSRDLDRHGPAFSSDFALDSAFMPLTDRELEILRKVSDGMTNAEIGYALGISAKVVRQHVTSILRKLAVNDRTQAVVTAIRRGWLPINDEGPDSAGALMHPRR
jgi:DNA-binding NarL/FixJ family response regulator